MACVYHSLSLKYSWFTMLYEFLVYKKVIPFFFKLSILYRSIADYNVVLVSSIHSDSFIYIYIFFQIIFHCRLLQDTEHSSLCYTAVPGCLFCVEQCVSVKSGHSFWSPSDFLPRQLQWLKQWFQSMCQMPKHPVALQLFLNHLKHCLNHLLAGKQLRC